MSEENQTEEVETDTTETPQEDPLKNYKAEMNRKLDNMKNEMASVNQQLLQQIQNLSQPRQTSQSNEDDFDDLFLDNPREAARRIKEEAAAEIRADIEKQQQVQQRQQSVLGELVQKFPELNDNGSELTQKAVEIYNSLSAEDQKDPKSYKLAVTEAAVELGVQPMSRRKKTKKSSDDDSFSVSSGSNPSTPKTRDGDVDARTIEFARMVGMDVENEKIIQNLKKRAKRTKWSTYQ